MSPASIKIGDEMSAVPLPGVTGHLGVSRSGTPSASTRGFAEDNCASILRRFWNRRHPR